MGFWHPSKAVTKINVVHVENITSYRGIDVRPGMSSIYYTGSYVSSPEAFDGEPKLWSITNGDCNSKYFPLSEIYGGLSSLEADQIADVVMNPWDISNSFQKFYA